jgi:hypothetical protein
LEGPIGREGRSRSSRRKRKELRMEQGNDIKGEDRE